ncbi:MAG: protoheme IX farnesyltransferase [Pseudomonadota bacterium]|jgi:protoheme IX farnesyltransferase|nr:protoheme IX farnesyltransferase [Rubrivivax sp.]
MSAVARPRRGRLRQFLALTKPRVLWLIVFCAVIGMFLGSPTLPPGRIVFFATVGIALVAGAAAAINCLIEQGIDAVMARTRHRPLPSGELNSMQTAALVLVTGGTGLFLLHHFVNALTMWLTLATFIGYAFVYTVLLKPSTAQNIVIGGASGAMPPVLGWAAVAGDVPLQAWLLFLIIFVWTPPHFWSLALYRTQDYARVGLPMLPVMRGREHTLRVIVRYTWLLVVVTLLPCAVGMSRWPYLLCAAALGARFVWRAHRQQRRYSDDYARGTFKYSILYLAALFAALLADHHLAPDLAPHPAL